MTTLLNFLNCNLLFFAFLFFLGFLFLFTALLTILTESSVHSILYLMFLFLYLTELTIVLKMEFLALIFIIVYIGAVCVLMLFHIKLIKTFVHRFDNIHNKDLFLPFLVVSIILPLIQIFTLSLETKSNFKNSISLAKAIPHYLENNKIYSTNSIHFNYTTWIDLYETFKSTQILGFLLYNIYFLYLILGSFILLIAMIGSIFLTLSTSKVKKYQSLSQQIFTEVQGALVFRSKAK